MRVNERHKIWGRMLALCSLVFFSSCYLASLSRLFLSLITRLGMGWNDIHGIWKGKDQSRNLISCLWLLRLVWWSQRWRIQSYGWSLGTSILSQGPVVNSYLMTRKQGIRDMESRTSSILKVECWHLGYSCRSFLLVCRYRLDPYHFRSLHSLKLD